MPRICYLETSVGLSRLVGSRLAGDLNCLAFLLDKVSRRGVYALRRANVWLVCPNCTWRVLGLAGACYVVAIARVNAANLSCVWLVCSGQAGVMGSRLRFLYEVAHAGGDATRSSNGRLISAR